MFMRSRALTENHKILNKPLTRASLNALNQQQKGFNRNISKIPRPHRNIHYAKTSLYAVATFKVSLQRSIGTYYGTTNANFINGTKERLKKRQFSTKARFSSRLKRVKFRSWFTLTSVSLIFFGVVARNLIEDDDTRESKESKEKRSHNIGSWPLYMYSRLPLNSLSRLWGQLNSISLPVWLRGPSFKLYSVIFGVNLDEMADPDLTHYKNLAEFFCRPIKSERRPIDTSATLCSPCDGKVLKFGIVEEDGGIEQVKGITYKVDALLGTHDAPKVEAPPQQFDPKEAEKEAHFIDLHGDIKTLTYKKEGDQSFIHPSTSRILSVSRTMVGAEGHKETNKLFYAVIYLAPGDYHRFHSPVEWVATLRRHFVGQLYSVAPYFQRTLQNLFILNERVAILGYWRYGLFSMTPVGATNVGSIKLNFDTHLATNEVYEHEIYSKDKLNEALTEKYKVRERKKLKRDTCYEATYANASKLLHGIPLFRGEEMGGFKLGSTIVLVFEAPPNFQFDLQENQQVLMGQGIGRLGS
ncbi:hypothetical protein KL928_004171 [Ogataea angusta]|uniref:Phosphatidylserine decarboxylase proenzyme 1, mitochondrial n=1 Tax=Pichia angusta TaxID=870730 RepID=A0AAN6I4V4_PICAN|nr:uncharacterized protein KL928_004171 [Ogataea angusta]KAG7816707.1 hypothetical protein KL928_004171 [Ogataea angusta]